ncbi:unnamed protein product [Rhodiola kirilowii]
MAESPEAVTDASIASHTTPIVAQSNEFFNPADDPMFVGNNENIGASLVSSKLVNADNFIPWRASMIRSLGIKAKLGFVQGLFPKPVGDPYKLARWERCNGVVLSWIINSVSDEIATSLVHSVSCVQAWNNLQSRFGGDNSMREYSIAKEITLLMQGELTVASYFNKLLQLWGDEDSYENDVLCNLGDQCLSTKCMQNKKMKTRIQKFLMGLNEVHAQIRTQILATRPRLGLDAAYALVVDDEMEKLISKPKVTEASALYTAQTRQTDRYNQGQNSQYFNRNAGQTKNYSTGNSSTTSENYSSNNRSRRPFCTHCQVSGHVKETCYKLNGFPPGHRLHKDNNSQTGRTEKHIANSVAGTNPSTAGNVPLSGESKDATPSQLTQVQEQLSKLLHLFNQKENKDQSQYHMAGISCFTTTKVPHDTWILDSGATDHITPHIDLLFDVKLLSIPYEVIMPNGSKAQVTHTGSSIINSSLTIVDVLLVPDFQFNLMSVGKLVSQSSYAVTFVDNVCHIQEPVRHTILGTGNYVQGLYQLDVDNTTPMDIKHKLALSTAPKLADPTAYRTLVGKLIYLNMTRPDIAFPVHILSQFLAVPTEDHLQAAHRVLRYIKLAPAQGLLYPARAHLTLEGFCDADWAACPISRRSTTGYSIKLGPSLISWRTRKQAVVSRSSAESEYRAMAQTCCELVWVVAVLKDLRISVPTPIALFCDNKAANHIARNPVYHERTKHIEIDCHVVRQYVANGLISPCFVGTLDQPADMFTKALPADALRRLSHKLGISNFLHAKLEGG